MAQRAAIAVALVLLCAGIYWPVRQHPFINYDDAQYVAANAPVLRGLTVEGVAWAFATPHAGNWHPLTWISHMVDVELFGVSPGPHHAVSAALHTLATLLLFGVLLRMTGAVWRSGTVAALFAVHPTHVESVAWVAERKDVLSAVFWMLTIGAYARYAAAPSAGRYVLVLLALVAGLLSKPMVVTLPFVLLLLDVWPLRRFEATSFRRLIVEKLPLFACVLVASVVTFVVQQGAGAVRELETFGVTRRLSSAAVGYVEYLGKTFWPADLAVLYPHPPSVPPWQVIAAVVLLVAITVAVVRAWRDHPYLAVGWFWFAGTLVPVIGLVQVGAQRIADRYLYLPSIGLFIAICWGGAALLSGRAGRRRMSAAVAAGLTIVLVLVQAVLAQQQVEHWSSSVALWRHTLEVTEGNAWAHNHLGHALAAEGRSAEAMAEYERALQIHPSYPEALNNLGAALAQRGEVGPAIDAFRRAIEIAPALPHARSNLGLALAQAGRNDEALVQFTEVVRTEPSNAEARRRRGALLAMLGRAQEAVGEYREAIRLDPGDARAHNALGAALLTVGQGDEGIREYRAALAIDADYAEARANLGRALIASGRRDEGTGELHSLAVQLVRQNRIVEAVDQLEVILTADPNHAPARQLVLDLAAARRRR